MADTLITFVTTGSNDRGMEINQQQPGSEIYIYPNPGTGIFFTRWTEQGFNNIEIWTPDGRLLQKILLTDHQHEAMIDLGMAPPGLYIIRLAGGGVPSVQKKIILTR